MTVTKAATENAEKTGTGGSQDGALLKLSVLHKRSFYLVHLHGNNFGCKTFQIIFVYETKCISGFDMAAC